MSQQYPTNQHCQEIKRRPINAPSSKSEPTISHICADKEKGITGAKVIQKRIRGQKEKGPTRTRTGVAGISDARRRARIRIRSDDHYTIEPMSDGIFLKSLVYVWTNACAITETRVREQDELRPNAWTSASRPCSGPDNMMAPIPEHLQEFRHKIRLITVPQLSSSHRLGVPL